jgi:hypothetical protein
MLGEGDDESQVPDFDHGLLRRLAHKHFAWTGGGPLSTSIVAAQCPARPRSHERRACVAKETRIPAAAAHAWHERRSLAFRDRASMLIAAEI